MESYELSEHSKIGQWNLNVSQFRFVYTFDNKLKKLDHYTFFDQ